MYRRNLGLFIAAALGFAGLAMRHAPTGLLKAPEFAPNGGRPRADRFGRPCHAAAQKRAARARRNIRARSSKRSRAS